MQHLSQCLVFVYLCSDKWHFHVEVYFLFLVFAMADTPEQAVVTALQINGSDVALPRCQPSGLGRSRG